MSTFDMNEFNQILDDCRDKSSQKEQDQVCILFWFIQID